MTKKWEWVLFFSFAAILIAVRLPSFSLPLDTDSSANAFFARHMLRGVSLYDTYHPAHHLPGIYYTFELAFRLFGDNPLAPKYLLFPWALACAWLMFLIGRSFFNAQAGILCAFFFILVSSQRWVTGQTAEMEHFANLPLIAGMFVLLLLLRRRAASWCFIFVGILGALSVLYKVTFIAPMIVAGICILGAAWLTRNEAGVWKTMFSRLVWMAIGLILPLVLVAAYFASLGLWNRFILVFVFGFTYLNDPHLMGGSELPRPFGFPLFWMSVNNISLLFFGLIGTYRLIRRSIPFRSIDNITDFAMALWLIISFALAGMRGGGFAHYILPSIPPLVFAAAVEIQSTYQRWKETSLKKYALPGAFALTALVIGNFLFSNYELYNQYLMYRIGIISQEDFIQYVEPDGYASLKIADFIKSHTAQDDFIYIWSIHVEPYYYADRLPPIDILWPSYAGATGSPDRIFSSHTKYIVLDTPKRWPRPQWLVDGLAAGYNLETVIEGKEIYRRNSP